MNQKEYKYYLQKVDKSQRPKDFFKYRNLAEKLLGYKRRSGLTIHHLRDTEEQRNFNDQYYERWGIDFDGQMKYCICITTEEHKKLHAISQETREKISKSVSISKTKLTVKERKENHIKSDNNWKEQNKEYVKQYKRDYYIKNKDKITQNTAKYRQKNKEQIKAYKKVWKKKNHDKVIAAKRKAYLKKKLSK